MKKICILMLIILCAAVFAACGENSNGATADEATDETEKAVSYIDDSKTNEIETPYAVLKVPEAFDGNVTHKVTSEDPYTLEFSANDGTKLFTLFFNGKGETLLGTIEGEKDNTVLYATVAKIDNKSENYSQYSEYQEGLGTIVTHLKKDYTFTENAEVEKEDESTFDIKTDVVTLKYPAKWKDKVDVKTDANSACFSSDGVKLFDIFFVEKQDGIYMGSYDGKPIYLVSYKFDGKVKSGDKYTDLARMQEDVNVIFDNLKNDEKYSKE